MRTLIHKLRKNKIKYSFQKADIAESAEALKNPSRGWYRMFLFCLEKEPDFETVSWSIVEDDTLAMVVIDIGAYRERPMDMQALERMKRILLFFQEKSMDIVLRIVYDHEGNAMEREPFFFAQVKEHLEQLLPVVQEFQDTIFVLQGMLIGNWGEMHTSRFLAPAKMAELWQMMKNAGMQVFFAVRKPSQWRVLHPKECVQMQLPCDTMGLFDDAILGSESHLGTFGAEKRENAGWDSMWSREDELDFEEALCVHVPNGGEAIYEEEYTSQKNGTDMIATISRMHLTYLNRDYDSKILDLWREWQWEEAGLWQGISLFDYIGRHLGYRFTIRDVAVTPSDNKANKMLVSIGIENVGFANLYEEAELYLQVAEAIGIQYEKKIDCDLRRIGSGSTKTVVCTIDAINCRLLVGARRKWDGRRICFANHAEKDGSILLGEIADLQLR